MTRLCGYPLDSFGRQTCTHKVTNPQHRWCFQHRRLVKQLAKTSSQAVDERGCRMAQDKQGRWRCETHNGEAWATAQAMGADAPPCRIPLPEGARIKMAQDPSADADNMRLLASDPSSAVRALAARSLRAPTLLDRLADDPADEVRGAVSMNPHTPSSALFRLAHDVDGRVLQQAIQRISESVGADGMRQVAQSPDSASQYWAAVTPRTPPDALIALVQAAVNNPTASAADYLAIALASNKALPTEAARQLASYPLPEVREKIAKLASLTAATAQQLAGDQWPTVRQAAAGRPTLPETDLRRLAQGHTELAMAQVAERSDAPVEVLESLSRHRSDAVASAVAVNPRTPPAVLERMSHGARRGVLECLWRNPNLPASAKSRIQQTLQSTHSTDWPTLYTTSGGMGWA